jgi:adenosine deaminase
MKYITVILFVIAFISSAHAQDELSKTSAYLEKIRNNESQLQAFFHQMPKGGDLHHHFSGAVYAETFFDTAVGKHYSLDTTALVVYPPGAPTGGVKSIVRFDSMSIGKRSYFKDRLIRLWSVKDFGPCDGASDAHFFATFGLFGPTIAGSEAAMLQEIKLRAIAEHTDYIETMFMRPSLNYRDPAVVAYLTKYNPLLAQAEARRDTARAWALFNEMYKVLRDSLGVLKLAETHHARLVSIRNAAVLPNGKDSLITIRFLNYVTRASTPADVFAQLYISFASCDMDSLVMGVNIVAPENADVSMNDYWLHMRMFRLFGSRFTNVHISTHAGELVLGMVKPEDLTFHITDAVRIAHAERIGHGVDIAYERNVYGLLEEMRTRKTAVEINLTSNEFILGVKGAEHPINLYHSFGVPIVISTDDPGVLRSDHSGEFVKLASRYPNFTYSDIKQFVYNSIEYSFMKEIDKSKLKKRLDREFELFEAEISTL